MNNAEILNSILGRLERLDGFLSVVEERLFNIDDVKDGRVSFNEMKERYKIGVNVFKGVLGLYTRVVGIESGGDYEIENLVNIIRSLDDSERSELKKVLLKIKRKRFIEDSKVGIEV